MKSHAIHAETIDQGLDRQNLMTVRKRFLAINQNRLTRLRNALGDRQQMVLDALPLLFHTNHPMMPGFVSRNTPSRISNHKLSSDDVQLGRNIARSFTANIDVSQDEQIYGIYVMGSVGTIAQSEKSDLDIWLCYRPGLSRSAIESLNEKCEKISAWAMSVRLEVHFFLMDHQAFGRGQLSALNEESSGSAQRLLLLDEFYRTAIYLAGRYPLWWFVPSSLEHDYANYTSTLLGKRFLSSDLVLDFGGLATIPDGEFVGAGIWQLYKAIESPYKSVLKLLLLEAYADQHPHIVPLSLSFKTAVYHGQLDIDELDSYVMIYRRIEEYLFSKNQLRRLELARRCFYFKVNKPLSKPPRGREKSWQRVLLERMVGEWGWNPLQIEIVDRRPHWKAPQVADERGLLVNELNHSYRFIQGFANHTGAVRSISTEELAILGRKLQAAFERKPGKIEWINPGISRDLSEAAVSISEAYDQTAKHPVWTLFAREPGTSLNGMGIPIKASVDFVELVLWCYLNGIIENSTYFDLQDAPSLNEYSVRKLMAVFAQWLPLPMSGLDHDSFKRAATPTHVMWLLNVGKTANPHLEEQGIQRLSDRGDALRYSGFEENLVVCVDMVVRNSWNEINTRRFDSQNALLDALQEYLQLCLPGTHQSPPRLQVECVGSQHAAIIANRVRAWFTEITHCYFSGHYPATTRYLFEMAGQFYSLQFRGLRLQARSHRNLENLINYLGEEQLGISPILLDSRALLKHPLRVIVETISGEVGGRAWAGAIHVFFQRHEAGLAVYVVDEMGSLIYNQFQGAHLHTPLYPLHRFLRAVIERLGSMDRELVYNFGVFPVHFFELGKANGDYLAAPKRVSTELPAHTEFDVTALAYPADNGEILYDFRCDTQAFTYRAFSDQLFLVVARYILKRRASSEPYPVYITDLDLSRCTRELAEHGRLTTGHYLKIKHRLEVRLNEAIGILLSQ